MEFNDLLVDESTLTKLAVEGPDQQQIEQDFGRMAYAFLKDRAASLIPYLIGFEVVEQEPDGSRAVGLFGFDVHGKYFYVPTFYLSNQIKGMDLLYDKNSDMFYPLRENWINHILNKQTITLGGKAPAGVSADFDVPDFNYISDPPLGGSTKLSAHQIGTDLAETWNSMQDTIIESLNSDPDFKAAYANAILTMKGEETVKEASYLVDFIEQKGGPDLAQKVAMAMQNTEFIKAATVFYDVKDLLVSDFSEALAPKEAKDVKIISRKEITDYSKDMSDEDRTKIVRHGFTVKDNRTEEMKSDVYTVDYDTSVQNPDRSGEYDLILASGLTVPAYVFSGPYGGSEAGMVLVVDKESGRHFTAHERAVFVRERLETPSPMPKAGAGCYEKADDIDDMQMNTKYILVSDEGYCSLPFKPKSIISEDGSDVRIKVDWCHNLDYGDSFEGTDYPRAHVPEQNYRSHHLPYGQSYIIPVDRTGGLRTTGKNLIAPKGTWKAYKLLTQNDYDEEQAAQEAFAPASYFDVKENLLKMAYHDVVVSSMGEGIGYNISIDGTMTRDDLDEKEAAWELAKGLGIDADETFRILGEVKTAGASKRFVKFAQQVSMPDFPPQYTNYDAHIGVPVEPAQEDVVYGQSQQYNPPYVGPGDAIQMGGEGERQQMTAGELGQQAAAAGQQQVFDHSVVGGLAQTYDVSFAIDSYVPDLLKCLDRIGRILFLFYWKNVDFAERYGDQDLTAMEDQLRGVFKSLGDLSLKLKQKTIDSEDTEFIEGGVV